VAYIGGAVVLLPPLGVPGGGAINAKLKGNKF